MSESAIKSLAAAVLTGDRETVEALLAVVITGVSDDDREEIAREVAGWLFE